MKRRKNGLKRKRVECPDCGYEFTISWRKGVRYFRAKRYGCPNTDCNRTGRRGEWPRRL